MESRGMTHLVRLSRLSIGWPPTPSETRSRRRMLMRRWSMTRFGDSQLRPPAMRAMRPALVSRSPSLRRMLMPRRQMRCSDSWHDG